MLKQILSGRTRATKHVAGVPQHPPPNRLQTALVTKGSLHFSAQDHETIAQAQ